MRDIWREFDEVEKNYHLKDKNSVHPLFSTSFGLHVAILTNEGKGKRKFVFTQRSNRKGRQLFSRLDSFGWLLTQRVMLCTLLNFWFNVL